MPTGSERFVLAACVDLAGDGSRFVTASDIARTTKMGVWAVQDCLRGLDRDGYVDLAPLENGDLAASLTPKGRQELAKDAGSVGTPIPAPSKERQIKVVPKGLRSYDEHDAEFFLELLPGPRRTDGLPESIHLWKVSIEETDRDKTFRVGLIFGPSGCGKSSLVRAGILPKLDRHVLKIYVEASTDQTEAHLVREIRKRCPNLPPNLGLDDSLASLSEGRGLSHGMKVLIVLDQFEQWLSTWRGDDGSTLVGALRHCDGGHVQTIIIVREEFWMAVNRFEKQVEVEFRRTLNSLAVELFDPIHAEKVLADFGRGFGRLPEDRGAISDDQEAFLAQAVEGLVEKGKIAPVRLSLFAWMVQGKSWTPATLKEVGGAEGVGVNFLEETFGLPNAEPKYRLHQKAAQAVLKALLPEGGTRFGGGAKSYSELLSASGYAHRPEDFDVLCRILDEEVRLITHTVPVELSDGDWREPAKQDEHYYQLTHDYLVPSLRKWLSLKPLDDREIEDHYRRLLTTSPIDLYPIIEKLRPHKDELSGRLWNVLEQTDDESHYLQAASTLALYAPEDSQWQMVGGKVARAMVKANVLHLGFWLDALRPARDKLTAPLATIYRDTERPETERSLAFNILEDYASDDPTLAADLLMDADKAYAAFFPIAQGQTAKTLPLFQADIRKQATIPYSDKDSELVKNQLAERQARAAVALLRMDKVDEVLPLLRHSADPRLRSFIVNWLNPLGADPKAIVAALDRIDPNIKPTPAEPPKAMDAILFHPETSQRRALILALGTYGTEGLSPDERQPLISKLLALYRNDPDSGIHGAAEWTLRKWEQQEKLAAIDVELKKLKDRGNRRWYVNSEGLEMSAKY